MSETLLTDLQTDLVEFLKADEYLPDVVILNERTADIATEITNALSMVTEAQSKIGLAAIVLQIVGTAEFEGVPFTPLVLDISIRVLEDPTLNNHTGKTAFSVARRIADALSHFAIVGRVSNLVPGKPTIAPARDEIAPVAYEVHFQGREIDATNRSRVSIPSISPSSGSPPQTVTLSTVTSGAAIYYTLDGSFPRSGGATSVLYTAPISITTPKTLRCAAYKTGSMASNINRADYA